MFSYTNLKKYIYVFQTALGILFLWLGSRLRFDGTNLNDLVVGVILGASGLLLILFGLTTFLLRNDQDIWR